jgi:hydroxymethylbilane synthase
VALRLATRGSALALAQARQVAALLGGAELVVVRSDGEPGDKARFVSGVEKALLEGRADIGVHSAKDLPAAMPEELALAGVPARERPADAWVGPNAALEEVAEGARVGTASLRRRSQLLALRPDLRIVELHGNVDTRLRRLREGELEALVLAGAGLRRLDRGSEISFELSPAQMTPAAGQGALVLQARRGEAEAKAACAAISDESALIELTAERAAVAALEADCTSPVGISARRRGQLLTVAGYVGLADGSQWVRDELSAEAGKAGEAGAELAGRMRAAGATELLGSEAAAAGGDRGGRR